MDTVHVPVNGKRNVAIDFAIIEARLNAKKRGVNKCMCGSLATEVLEFYHPNIPSRGICNECLDEWRKDQII